MGQWENQCPETPWKESGSRVTKSLKSAHLLTLFKEAKAWIIPWTTVAKSQKWLSLSLSRRKNVILTSVPCRSTDKHKNPEMTRVIAKQAMRYQYEGMAINPLKMTSMWTVLITGNVIDFGEGLLPSEERIPDNLLKWRKMYFKNMQVSWGSQQQ